MLVKKYYITCLTVILMSLFTVVNSEARDSHSLYDFSTITISDEPDEQTHAQIKAMAQNMADPIAVKEKAIIILEQLQQGSEVSNYDFLWIPYALLKSAYAGSGSGLSKADELTIAQNTVNYINDLWNQQTGIWEFTDSGQFEMEVYRTASNAAAWSLRNSKPKQALVLIDSGLEHARSEDLHMWDTKVRILLNLEQKNEAYMLVKTTLQEHPDFSDFQDFKSNEDYLAWLKEN